jgi:hypothetical protein
VPTFFYRVLLVLVPALFCHPVLSQDADLKIGMYANVATRMVENGRTDNDRLYLFYFSYSDFGQVECDVGTLVIHNLTCSSGLAASPLTAPWIAPPGFCDLRKCPSGEGRLSCTRKALGDGRYEYTFRIPAGLEHGYSSHRLIMQMNPYQIFEYSGSLSNYAGLDRTIKSAKYVPVVSTSNLWLQEVDLGCSRISFPTIRRK